MSTQNQNITNAKIEANIRDLLATDHSKAWITDTKERFEYWFEKALAAEQANQYGIDTLTESLTAEPELFAQLVEQEPELASFMLAKLITLHLHNQELWGHEKDKVQGLRDIADTTMQHLGALPDSDPFSKLEGTGINPIYSALLETIPPNDHERFLEIGNAYLDVLRTQKKWNSSRHLRHVFVYASNHEYHAQTYSQCSNSDTNKKIRGFLQKVERLAKTMGRRYPDHAAFLVSDLIRGYDQDRKITADKAQDAKDVFGKIRYPQATGRLIELFTEGALGRKLDGPISKVISIKLPGPKMRIHCASLISTQEGVPTPEKTVLLVHEFNGTVSEAFAKRDNMSNNDRHKWHDPFFKYLEIAQTGFEQGKDIDRIRESLDDYKGYPGFGAWTCKQ